MVESASKAVFLSYASQDAEAAQRICTALRAAGVEVWFDQSDLRGGEAWDAGIRRQIGGCALFVPVVSAATQARREGYFRLEWRLADERTHLMAEGTPFLLPVTIDDTTERSALVPKSFLPVQWTRLPAGEASPAFVDRVKALLAGGPAGPATGTQAGHPPGRRATGGNPVRIGLLAGGLVLVAIAAGYWAWVDRETPRVGPVGEPRVSSALAPAPVGDKSIAVLPFRNLSDDKDNNAFFAIGIHEDILTNLAHIRELRVISRTSVERYRNGEKTLRQIGAELGVAWILEGSVQRAGNKVHVTGQLINAHTDEHVWAENYNRDLTDVFAVQAELASAIASALQATLSPLEKAVIARRPTLNPAAYDLFLKGRESLNHDNIAASAGPILEKREILFQGAVELDPNFAEAWAELAVIHAFHVFGGRDQSADRVAKARAAMDRAVQLAPDSPDVIRLLGDYYYYSQRDYTRAAGQYAKVIRLQPNDATAYYSLGLILRRQGRWGEALPNLRRATELEPGNLTYARVLAGELNTVRRYDESAVERHRLVNMSSGDLYDAYELAKLSWHARGSTREVEAFFARFQPEEAESIPVLSLRLKWASDHGDTAEIVRLDGILSHRNPNYVTDEEKALDAAWAMAARGDTEGARARLGDFPAKLRAKLEMEPGNDRTWAFLGQMEALLGHKDEALRCCGKALELMPESLDALNGPVWRYTQIAVLAWVGEKDRAIAGLAHLLSMPNAFFDVSSIKADFTLISLRDDPRFLALVNDPKNSAPFF